MNSDQSGPNDANTLVRLTMPQPPLAEAINLFWHQSPGSSASQRGDSLWLAAHSSLSFDTYFNSLNLKTLRKHTTITRVNCHIRLSGKLAFKIKNELGECVFEAQLEDRSADVFSCFIAEFNADFLFVEVVAITDCQLFQLDWWTDEKPQMAIHLTIGITHFKREEAVKRSASRIIDFAESHPALKLDLIIADNSSSLNVGFGQKCKILPNKNLGGAGGFARIMLAALERNVATHLLFMDDDAACASESIRRTYVLLSFANDFRNAIIGSMLLEDQPYIHYECGALFDEYCKPIGSNINIGEAHGLTRLRCLSQADYGGWWYFAFPIESAGLPYPFFVRGDDVDFGLRHDFRLISYGGIASLQPRFELKDTPLTQYLDVRHQLAHYMHGHKQMTASHVWRVCTRGFLKPLLSFRYDTAFAAIQAAKDIIKGPAVFWDDPAAERGRSAFAQQLKHEKIISLNEAFRPHQVPAKNGSLIAKTAAVFWALGLKVPGVRTRTGRLVVRGRYDLDEIYAYEEVLYERLGQIGFLCRRKPLLAWRIMIEGFAIAARLVLVRKRVSARFTKEYAHLTSREYWKNQLKTSQEMPADDST